MLKITDISKSYNQKDYAVKKLSFGVKRGNILALLGHNGAGKSTTLRIISGMISLNSGQVFIDGTDLSKANSEELRKIKRNIGFISETTNLLDYLTAWEYIFYIGKMYGIEDEQRLNQNIHKLVQEFNIVDAREKSIKEFSAGVKKRIALASIMINSPDLLLLDEPTIHLDPIGVKIFKQYLKELSNNGTAIILATHQLDIAEKLADDILIINEGEKLFQGTMDELRNSIDGTQETDSLENYYAKLIQN